MKNNQLVVKKNKKKHDTIEQVSQIMENPEFIKIFDKHFDNWDDIKTIIMMMKIYRYVKLHNPDLNQDQMSHIIRTIILNPQSRSIIANQMNEFINHNEFLGKVLPSSSGDGKLSLPGSGDGKLSLPGQ